MKSNDKMSGGDGVCGPRPRRIGDIGTFRFLSTGMGWLDGHAMLVRRHEEHKSQHTLFIKVLFLSL